MTGNTTVTALASSFLPSILTSYSTTGTSTTKSAGMRECENICLPNNKVLTDATISGGLATATSSHQINNAIQSICQVNKYLNIVYSRF